MTDVQALKGWRWVFVSRETGRVSVMEWPNLPLWVWIVCSAAGRLPWAEGRARDVLGLIGTAALVIWGVGEVLRGVNPWRRALGATVLLGMALTRVL